MSKNGSWDSKCKHEWVERDGGLYYGTHWHCTECNSARYCASDGCIYTPVHINHHPDRVYCGGHECGKEGCVRAALIDSPLEYEGFCYTCYHEAHPKTPKQIESLRRFKEAKSGPSSFDDRPHVFRFAGPVPPWWGT